MKYLILILLITTLISCSKEQEPITSHIDSIAEHYVKLVLATGKFDADYVDAYFGPKEWKTEALKWNLNLVQIKHSADSLVHEFDEIDTEQISEIELQRLRFLKRQIQSLSAKASILSGTKLTFDEESQALFDAVAPSYPDEKYQIILDSLEKLIPGKGKLDERFIKYREQFIIPPDKVDTVFKASITESRRRTLKHIKLPKNETFVLEYVHNKSWGGYNWFKGNAASLIQINMDLPKYIDGALGLLAHEGYPGHHAYHSLMEENFINKNGWLEFTVYPLFSPEALLSEGTANFGIEVAFPKAERIKFEKEVLFPLAGISPEKADEYYSILDLMQKLDYGTIDIARNYLESKITRDEAIQKIMKFKLRSKEQAEINVKFFEQYRSYIINYYIGEELCRNWVKSRVKNFDDENERWKAFIELLSHPHLPSDLGE